MASDLRIPAGADPDGEIGECHVPETHAIPLLLDAAAAETKGFTIYGDDYPTADGTCVRDYIHVTDLADAHVKAVRALLGGADSTALNLGTGRGWSVRELEDRARRTNGSGPGIRPRASPRRRALHPDQEAAAMQINDALSRTLGRDVEVVPGPGGGYRVHVTFSSLEDALDLAQKLSGNRR